MTMLKTELVNQKAKHMRNVKECQRNEIVGGKKTRDMEDMWFLRLCNS